MLDRWNLLILWLILFHHLGTTDYGLIVWFSPWPTVVSISSKLVQRNSSTNGSRRATIGRLDKVKNLWLVGYRIWSMVGIVS